MSDEERQNIICVVATSEETAFMKRRVAYLVTVIAEFFRKNGKNVVCFLDSITRFAMAKREIGLALGELPTSRGYTASVFTEIPKIIERMGVSTEEKGSITGFITVLMEGDDENEIISDTLRGVLDGHILLDRNIASKNIFPAVNILKSVSRYYPDCNTNKENDLVKRAKNIFVEYEEIIDIIKLGLYKKGSNKDLDNAVSLHPILEKFCCQDQCEKITSEQSFLEIEGILKTDNLK